MKKSSSGLYSPHPVQHFIHAPYRLRVPAWWRRADVFSRARPQCASRLPPMAICAPNIAFCDFCPNLSHWPQVAHHRADARDLDPTDVIEFKNARIRLAAVDTRMVREVLNDGSASLSASLRGPVYDSPAVHLLADTIDIVGAIHGLARFADAMPLRHRFVAKAKLLDRLVDTTTSTPFHTRIISNACASMVAFRARIFARARNGAPGGS
jgi:hypothetical protein